MTYTEAHFQERAPGGGGTATVGGEVTELRSGLPAYPAHLGESGPILYARGAVKLLRRRRVAVFALEEMLVRESRKRKENALSARVVRCRLLTCAAALPIAAPGGCLIGGIEAFSC